MKRASEPLDECKRNPVKTSCTCLTYKILNAWMPVPLPTSHFHPAFCRSVCPLSASVGSPLFVFNMLVGQWQMVLWAAGCFSDEGFHCDHERYLWSWKYKDIQSLKIKITPVTLGKWNIAWVFECWSVSCDSLPAAHIKNFTYYELTK